MTCSLRMRIAPRAWVRLGLLGVLLAWVALRCGVPVRWLFRITVA